MLIRDLTIQGYRCFEDFSMDGLTRVNLLVGNNNSGKTSFLEAIYLLVNQPSMGTGIKAIREIFDNRNEFSQKLEKIDNPSQQIVSREYFLDHLFYGYGNKKSKNFKINCIQEIGMSLIGILELKYEDYIALLYPHDKSMFEKEFNESIAFYSDGSLRIGYDLDLKSVKDDINEKIDYSSSINFSFLLSSRQVDFNTIAEIWDKISLTSKEEIVIESLKIILPNVERLGFSISPGVNIIKLKLQGLSELIPLSTMGDGMNRILALVMALVSTEKGVLLVDEIETGLHYEAQLDMWRLVLKTAQDLDVQVFATTHSWDCIAAFKEALQELEDQSVAKLFRLDSKYGKLRAVEYDASEIKTAVEQGIEVR
ncbi:MAG: AAA family ATPase [Snowella sp.]|nr:AAA family ATPase [Snowella sp.]